MSESETFQIHSPLLPLLFVPKHLLLTIFLFHLMLRFLWRENATFAISRHYRRFDVFEEAEANKAAGKYNNESIDYQINFYKREGLTRYSEAKLPITSGMALSCFLFFYFQFISVSKLTFSLSKFCRCS